MRKNGANMNDILMHNVIDRPHKRQWIYPERGSPKDSMKIFKNFLDKLSQIVDIVIMDAVAKIKIRDYPPEAGSPRIATASPAQGRYFERIRLCGK